MSPHGPSTGTLFVLSAPSGTGKSTLARVLAGMPGLEFSVSFTTRVAREGEADGRDYHFVDASTFDSMIESGGFLEWANVFGNYYGTGLAETRRVLERGNDLLLDIDIQGASQVRRGPIPAVSVMLFPPSYETLENRLAGRGSETPEQRTGRLARAREEAEDFPHFDYLIVNGNLDDTLAEIEAIVRVERRRTTRCASEAEKILSTFPARATQRSGTSETER